MKEYFWHYSFPMRKGVFDNDYFFMNDGNIMHFFDRTIQKVNIYECVTPQQISEIEKQTMYANCPEEYKERVKVMLEL